MDNQKSLMILDVKVQWNQLLGLSSYQYVKKSCANVCKYLANLNKDTNLDNQKYLMPRMAKASFENDYRQEIDVSDELSPELVI